MDAKSASTGSLETAKNAVPTAPTAVILLSIKICTKRPAAEPGESTSVENSSVLHDEDQHQFILHHRILWKGEDVDVAVPMVEEAQALYPGLRACSFDRGFHSPANRVRLDALLDVNALPGSGYLSKANRERESAESFVSARRAHPAIESAINGLEHRGLDRVRSHGADGFARAVALSVLAANLHRIGLLLQKRERKRLRRAA